MAKNLVSIAGYDPSGGAGVLLDLGVFEDLGHRGFGVLTAVTAQNPDRVERVFPLPARVVTAQFGRLSEAVDIGGIKVGMVATARILGGVAGILGRRPGLPRVVDPVFRSSSGALLVEKAAWPRFLVALREKADLITPNLDEAEILTGLRVRAMAEMRDAAARISGLGGMPCLLKGGHLEGPPVDILYDGKAFTAFGHPRQTRSVHGTGCYLSSAILVSMAEGRPLAEACRIGIRRAGAAIRRAVPAGSGRWVFDLSRGHARFPSPSRERS
jgi:hydroxymethylpyrimidine/phosphomethylpyrimidine kinase